jgi:regulator of RNase E activity RraA/CMP-N-acetylneuraminic acid synthetase
MDFLMETKKVKIVAFLPAKGTSARIPGKNMKLLNGKPVFLHTLEKICSCDFIDEVYLDTESEEMLEYASYLRYIPFKRDKALADNSSTGDMLIYNEAKAVDADLYIQIMCTFPFIRRESIKKGVSILLEHPEYDSVVMVKKDKLYEWKDNKPAYYVDGRIPNSSDLPDTLSETMGFYISRREVAVNGKRRVGDHPYPLEALPIEAVDINTLPDFEMAEKISKGLQSEEAQYLESIKHFFNSAVFSDILTEMKYAKVITGLAPNLMHKKIFGRANTLKIRAVREGETYKGIYEALKTYDKIQRGEIIVVENEFEDRAYFGELNAHLAVRAGAIGTIISGKTRDIELVSGMDYPVFSSGYSCFDIRGMATFGGHNKPVQIKGVTINPGDLIFADINGIAVIPREIEDIVLKKAIETVKTEKNVLNGILEQTNAYSIYEKDGEF